MNKYLLVFFVFSILCLLCGRQAFAQVPQIISISPTQNQINVSPTTNIAITFDIPMNETTIDSASFCVNGSISGRHWGDYGYDGLSLTVTFNPENDFAIGEIVCVVLTTDITSPAGIPLESSYAWSFYIGAARGYGHFQAGPNYQVGSSPESIISGDFNGDGNIDLATANTANGTVSTLLNNGDGTFADALSSLAGQSAGALYGGDVDYDGDLDLAIANNIPPPGIRILLNSGDGNFDLGGIYTSGHNPDDIVLADFTGDGWLDLASANWGAQNASILFNDGDGTYTHDSLYTTGSGPKSVHAGDYDNDGDLDVAIANRYANTIVILSNLGDSLFGISTANVVGGEPIWVTAADLNDDNWLDLISVDFALDQISILINNGIGTFSNDSTYEVGYQPITACPGDFDGDGDIDLATANSAGSMTLLLNRGDGVFVDRADYVVPGAPQTVTTADFDLDGDLDLALEGYNSGRVYLFYNQAPFYSGPTWHVDLSGSDFDGNGSEQYPYASIQHTVAVAPDGDTIIVHDGIYNEHIQLSMRWLHFRAAIDEAPTIVTDTARCLTIDNASHIEIDGLSFEGHSELDGGAISVDGSTIILTNATIHNSEVTAQTKGGGIYGSNATLVLSNCGILDNSISNLDFGNSGGGIYCEGYLTLDSCRIQDNILTSIQSSSYGGGVYIAGDDAIIHNCEITGNQILQGNGEGAGLFIFGNKAQISQCRVDSNEINAYQIYAYFARGSGMYLTGDSNIINTCDIFDNSVIVSQSGSTAPVPNVRGGGVYATGNGTTIIGNSFTDNSIDITCDNIGSGRPMAFGGHVYVDSSGELQYNTITGGGITIGAMTGAGTVDGVSAFGGGIYASGSFLLSNNTCAGVAVNGTFSNYNPSGSYSVLLEGGAYYTGLDATVNNSIASACSLMAICQDYGGGTASCNAFEMGSGIYSESESPTCNICFACSNWEYVGPNPYVNYIVNPLFCNSATGDYSVASNSFCLPENHINYPQDNYCPELIGAFGEGCEAVTRTWYVATDGSDETGDGSVVNPFSTIQHAIDRSSNLDTVIVAEGRYHELISFLGKTIIVASNYIIDSNYQHIENTIIDGDTNYVSIVNDTGSVVRFVTGEETSAALIGLSIESGIGTVHSDMWVDGLCGGGIYISGANPTIEACNFGGYQISNGDAIFLHNSDSTIVRECNMNNKTIMYVTSSPSLYTCNNIGHCDSFESPGTVIINSEVGRILCMHGSFTAIGSVVGSVFCYAYEFYTGPGTLEECTILGTVEAEFVSVSLTDCILYPSGGIALYANGGRIDVSCCVAYNYSTLYMTAEEPLDSTNLFIIDPLFCNAASGNYTLNTSSPCLQENNDCGVQIGAYGAGCFGNDFDGDGTFDNVDNCHLMFNPDQEDMDDDGKGDSCDVGEVLFEANPRCGGNPLVVSFTDLSVPIDEITEWFWDFGDGGTSTDQHPQHEYTDIGAFDVMLIVSDGTVADTLIKPEYITTQVNIQAGFRGLPRRGSSPLTVVFDPIVGGAVSDYMWYFGDGDSSSLPNPIHVYNGQGQYDVELRVSMNLDECNQADTLIRAGYVIINDLKAALSAQPTAGEVPLTVQFTDASEGSPYQWYWEFGDGGHSTSQNPVHDYNAAGIYDVFLRVTNIYGTDSIFKPSYIHVDTACADLCVDINTTPAKPGFDFWYYCSWANYGTVPAENCTLFVSLPEEVVFEDIYPGAINTGSYTGYDVIGDTFAIPLQTVEPSSFSGGYIMVTGRLPYTVPIGDTVNGLSWVYTTTYELDVANNLLNISQEVVGSWDPNDKFCMPEGEGVQHYIAPRQRLGYYVFYENLASATAEATYIRVVDTLDDDLDWGSLTFGPMSHPDDCQIDYDAYTGVIECWCDSIMLPPNVIPPEGEGFFSYSISPKSGLSPGTVIENNAWIRFDYNPWLQAPEGGPVFRTIVIPYLCGDANSDDAVNVGDAVYLINYVFKGGPAPDPECAGDANGDSAVNVGDAVYLIAYIFKGGPPPVDGCCQQKNGQ